MGDQTKTIAKFYKVNISNNAILKLHENKEPCYPQFQYLIGYPI